MQTRGNNAMKLKTAITAAVVLALIGVGNPASAVPPHDRPKSKSSSAKKRTAKQTHRSANGPMPCATVPINAKEDREIIILKLTQRIDCLESKVNYLSEQLSLQSNGAVKPFAGGQESKDKEFVIRYPHDAGEP